MSLGWKDRYDFAQAVLLLGEEVANGEILPAWIDDQHFWYERRGETGAEYAVISAPTGARRVVATRGQLAAALTEHLGAEVDPALLILSGIRIDLDRNALAFTAFGNAYEYSWTGGGLDAVQKAVGANWSMSPDGKSALFVQTGNLWLRDIATGAERALTHDGNELNAYGAVSGAMRNVLLSLGGASPEALWSPDGQWVLSVQNDEQHVPELPLIEFAPLAGGRPQLLTSRTGFPGDARVSEFRVLAIEVATGRQVAAHYSRLTAVRMNAPLFKSAMTWWSKDCRTAYFIDVERGEQAAHVVAFDVATGATRIVFSERSASYVELGPHVSSPVLVAPLPETNELIWYSERSGRGHLYLYDLESGELRNAITAGEWQVRDLLAVDAKRREVFILAGGIAADENPYIAKPCIASLDGDIRVVSDARGEHRLIRRDDMLLRFRKFEGIDAGAISSLSPGGDYFVEQVSSVTELPKHWLRTREGKEIALIETASGSFPPGWRDPEPVQCVAADGFTRTYGLLFKPLGYEPAGQYPVIDHIYGGPHVSHVAQASFAFGGLTSYLDAMFLSSAGAFVLVLDGRGTALREQAFRTASHGALQTASNIEDHIAAIRQLAGTHPQMDVERVGIAGFSGGGYAAAMAALRFGNFFKVAVAGGGNYDQALFWNSWGERYHGAYDDDLYVSQAARTYAAGMTGKLMLQHGMMDSGCHPAGFMQLVQALIDANKNPDIVILPRGGHDWTGYGLRRMLDYFVEHLIGVSPPIAESFKRPVDSLMVRVAANAVVPGSGPQP
jgi:dipeptidyl-peptidase-4